MKLITPKVIRENIAGLLGHQNLVRLVVSSSDTIVKKLVVELLRVERTFKKTLNNNFS